MGGDISVVSEYGAGSAFTITLPQKIHSHEPIADLNLNEHHRAVNGDLSIIFNAPEAKILVVDDVTTNLKVADGLLSPYKTRVDLCISGAKAIELIKSNDYDLVLMDHMMPEMDGVEATKIIRGFNSGVPVVALTANAVSGTREMFLANGFNDFLSKPIDTIKLNAILEKWIPKEKQKEANRNTSEKNVFGGKNLKILAAFYRDGTQKTEEIKKCLEAGDYSQFTTHVHGLKSAAISIEADELAELAGNLEEAGKRDDFDFIKAQTGAFLAVLKTYLNEINRILSANKDEST
jgi:CheY-like chemotaxis protein/HPt (histidine-containing phosphotransfer) domain-containing protein